MKVTYDKLWSILKRDHLLKKDLRIMTGISSRTMAKLTRGENVTTDILVKICDVLKCKAEDIFEIIPNEENFTHQSPAVLGVRLHKKFTFIDLFAGIGGFHIALEKNGGKCVFASEWDKYAQETYSVNFPETPLYGDITLAETKAKIPDNFDVLCGGFPCQAFSHAGLKKGFSDTRGTLFHEIANILQSKKPKVAFLENVRGLISHDGGRTLQIILQTLTNIGYRCNIPEELIKGDSTKQLQEEAKKMVLLTSLIAWPNRWLMVLFQKIIE